MEKGTQIGLVLISGFIYLINQIDGSIINKAFDNMFSLGLLTIVVVMLYREWKGAQAYNSDRDRRMEKLIENNTSAINSFREEIKVVHERINDNTRRLNEQSRVNEPR